MYPLISTDRLAELLALAHPPVILDVRYRLDAPDGTAAYRSGHIPGAVYVPLDDELAAHGAPSDGRHPLPPVEVFAAAVRRWGVNEGDTVVIYDDFGSMGAARAWWMLTDAGVPASVLDGGLSGWKTRGFALERGDVTPEPGNVTLNPGRLPQLDIDQAADLAQSGVLLDVRAPARFRGESEPIDPVAGHIPGARNAPSALNLENGLFRSPQALRELYADIDSSEPVGVYCGSGITAAQAALALTVAGFQPALYPGSWSQWCNTPERPIAIGD